MPTREEMRSLGEEIIGTYADRMATIGELRETVKLDLLESRRHLQELRDSRIATGKEIRADLAKSAAEGKAAVKAQLEELDRTHAAMSQELKADLAKSAAEGKAAVSTQLKELDAAHNAMSREMRADLAKDAANRKHEVGNMINGFGQALAIMGKEMRADLAKGLADRQREVGDMLRSFSAKLKKIRSELAGGRDEWHKLTATMQSKRGGVAVAVKPPAKGAVGITPKAATLRNQVFQYLANNPDGTKLVELEKEFGVTRIEMVRVVKSLMGENKIKKLAFYYFAI